MITIQKQIESTSSIIPALRKYAGMLKEFDEAQANVTFIMFDFEHTIILNTDISESGLKFELECFEDAYLEYLLEK